MSVVKSERSAKSVSPQSVMQLASELNVVVPTLTPSEPMPLGFSEAWQDTKDQLMNTVAENKDDSQLKMASLLGKRGLLVNRFFTWLNTSKRGYYGVFAGAFSTFGLFGAIAGASLFAGDGAAGVVAGFLIGSPAGILPLMVLVPVVEYREDTLLKPIKNAFSSTSYEQRVIEWAQERYGVTIPVGAWAAPSDRVSKDIAYLGVKDGESVYCFETAAGWVIGYRDGTELPVLVNEKVLVKA